MRTFFIIFLNIYQKMVSPLFPPSCRFYPTCSEYTKGAILKYGVFKGIVLGIQRVLRCNPFSRGGYDPIP
ncbi:MAG: membrane protein insertion efficiency factor YidD [bacterium]|nr:membrane protein insertion efficiency factor YidD [bacterium]